MPFARRHLALLVAALLAAGAAVAGGLAVGGPDRPARGPAGAAGPSAVERLLASGLTRYRAYAAGEAASAADRARALVAALRAGDRVRARRRRAELAVHLGRLQPALRAVGAAEAAATATRRLPAAVRRAPLGSAAVVRAAAGSLREAASAVGRLDVARAEARLAGALAAFEAVRDALWARDQGLVGSIDSHFDVARTELDRHRRGERFAAVSRGDTRRLRRALADVALRLELAPGRAGAL